MPQSAAKNSQRFTGLHKCKWLALIPNIGIQKHEAFLFTQVGAQITADVQGYFLRN